ncbi:MAG: ATP-binding protein [Bacteroidales bacterium]|nr:ATP-binding protein [Bacteroidales bacterium]
MEKIIGRKKEIAEIQRLYHSGKAELLAIYGRRRVGKTFLVDESLKNRITFRHAGLSPIDKDNHKNDMKSQLKQFFFSLKLHGHKGRSTPKSWMDAFYLLEQLLISNDNGQRQVVFLDELPWMDTPRSGFLTAFEGFWNSWACHRDNLMLVVCGSANSWILDNLINSRGGLYGRTTYEIHLAPFTLSECKAFYKSRKIEWSDYDILQSYMILGGIPYYMGYIDRELSLAQNINDFFWSKEARLRDEFNRLFESAFDSPEVIKRIVRFIGKRHIGFTRNEIIEGLDIPNGGLFTKRMRALVASNYVTEYIPFGLGKRELHYKLSDPFCLFSIHFLDDKTKRGNNWWIRNINSPSIGSWRGIAFEEVCFNHIPQIKAAIGITDVASEESAWQVIGNNEEKGLQIDLLIIRNDNVVNMCELKFYSDEFTVTKDYDLTIRGRINAVASQLPKKFSIQPTAITTFGLKPGIYRDVFVKQLTINELFT